MKRLALLVLGPMVAATFWVAAPALAQTGNDNTAVATNTKDNSYLFKFAFKVSRTAGDTVDAGNAAAAVASCSYCETVAVAIQVVLVSGDPSTFTPTNVAIAYNQDCYECVTLADAFQFVFGTGSEPAHLTKEGKDQLKAIKREFKDLQKNGGSLTPDELQARVAALAQQVFEVYSTQLVPKGNPSTASAPSTTSPPPSSTVGTSSPPTTTASTATTGSTTAVTQSPNTTAAG
jgi:putative peptide zinc metalloprotease protein